MNEGACVYRYMCECWCICVQALRGRHWDGSLGAVNIFFEAGPLSNGGITILTGSVFH